MDSIPSQLLLQAILILVNAFSVSYTHLTRLATTH